MKQQFKKNIILLLFVNVVIKPLYILGIDAQVQNRVGAGEYGIYFALFNFCFLFQILLDLGIQNYNAQFVASHRHRVGEHLPYVLSTKLMLTGLFFIVVLAAGLVMQYPPRYFMLLGLICLFMTFQSLYIYLRSHFSALGYYRTESWLSALDKLIMILVIGYMLFIYRHVTIESFVLGQVGSVFCAVIIVGLLLRSKVKVAVRFSLEKSRGILSKAMPFALVVLLMTLYTRMDGVMLEAMLDDNAVSAGIYAAGYRLLDAANMAGYLFALILLPMFAHHLANRQSIGHLVKEALGMLMALSTLITLVSWYYATDIMYLIYDDATGEYARVFRLLMVSFWFISISYIYGSLITASGRLKAFNIIFIIGIVINWSLNIILIPRLLGPGAALATLVTQAFVFLGQLYLAHRMFAIHYPRNFILKLVLNTGIAFAMVNLVYYRIALPWLLEVALLCIFAVIISFLLGFFRLSTEATTDQE